MMGDHYFDPDPHHPTVISARNDSCFVWPSVCVCMGGWLCYRWLMLDTHSTMFFSVLCVCLQPGRWITINDTGAKTASRQTKEKRRGTKDGQTAQEGRTMMGDVRWWLHCPQPSAHSSPFNFPTTNRRSTKWPICIAYLSDGSIYTKHIQLCFQALVQAHLQSDAKMKTNSQSNRKHF